MLHSLHFESDFEATCRCTQPDAASSRPATTPLGMFWDSLREGLAACRQYEHLRSSGVPHDTAIREALGFGAGPAHMRHGTKSLYFAGRV
jgi:hypothetical protein